MKCDKRHSPSFCMQGSDIMHHMVNHLSLIDPTSPCQVNMAIILDSSSSISGVERNQSIAFAKETVATYADLHLFEDGGTVSFAQFARYASDGGTFTSQEEFDAFVDATSTPPGGSRTGRGITRGRELLAASSSDAMSVMVVITDGQDDRPMVCVLFSSSVPWTLGPHSSGWRHVKASLVTASVDLAPTSDHAPTYP